MTNAQLVAAYLGGWTQIGIDRINPRVRRCDRCLSKSALFINEHKPIVGFLNTILCDECLMMELPVETR